MKKRAKWRGPKVAMPADIWVLISAAFIVAIGFGIIAPVLPQFAHPDQPWPLPVQLGVLGLEYIAITIAFLVPLGHAASRVLGSSTRIARATSLVTGVAMLLAGAALLVESVLALV